MRIADLPFRTINGVEYRDLPTMRRDDPRALLVGGHYALVRLTKLAERAGRDPEAAAVYTSLAGILAATDELDPDDLDDPRVGDLAARLAIWSEIVWYPRGEAIETAWSERTNQVAYRDWDELDHLEQQVFNFLDTLDEPLAGHGFETRAWEDRGALAQAMAGHTPKDILTDPALGERVHAVGGRRAAIAELAAGRSAADLVAEYEATMARVEA